MDDGTIMASFASWASNMALSSASGTDGRSLPFYLLTTAGLCVLVLCSLHVRTPKPSLDRIPHLNPRRSFELTNWQSKKQFVTGARLMLDTWFQAKPDKPVRVIADTCEVTVLPPHLANEMRNDPRLSFAEWLSKHFFGHLPGFEGFKESARDSQLLQAVIMRDLSKNLNKIIEPLTQETTLALEALCPRQDAEWHTTALPSTLLTLIARVSSRVFLGEQVCRDEGWLKVTRGYTVDGFRAAEALRLWPAPMRPIVHWFLPSCQRARAHVREARHIIYGVLEKRRLEKSRGGTTRCDDAVEWFEREAGGTYYDVAAVQLMLSAATIHNTADLVAQVMVDLARNPELVGELREEMVTALGAGGWKKASLYNMKLLDSVIKESQRLKPIGIVSMRRIARDDIGLSDGTFILKGSSVVVSSRTMWDPEVYERPNEFDGRRFLRMRMTPGNEHIAQLVSTSPHHLGFGHGQHACPGRFFASNQAKVILTHLLLKYDWKLSRGSENPQVHAFAFSLRADPSVKMEYRRRAPEIDLDERLADSGKWL